MRFRIGDKVVFLTETGGGIVKKINGSTYFVEDETGFDRPFHENQLGKVHGVNYQHTEEQISEILQKESSNTASKTQKKFIRKHKDYWEIDLHFEEIIDEYGEKMKLNREQALTKQLSVFRDFYHKAREKKMRKLIVIHGFGTGILREEIQIFLKGQDGVSFHDASYMEYGHGAIQVEIKYKY